MKFKNDEIEYECENKHKKTLSYDKFINESKKYSLNNIKCLNCYYIKSNDDIYLYCINYKDFICNNCFKKHSKNKGNELYILIKTFDGCCKEHTNSYLYYCKNCKKIFVFFAIMNIQTIILNFFQILYLMRKIK